MKKLVEMANERGGVDNITAIIVDVKKSDASKSEPPGPARAKRESGESTAVVFPDRPARHDDVDDD